MISDSEAKALLVERVVTAAKQRADFFSKLIPAHGDHTELAAATRNLVTPKGINENLAACEKPYETPDFGKELTGEDIDRVWARLRERERAQPVVLYEPRSSAAERLARLVIYFHDSLEGYSAPKLKDAIAPMVAEAKRVLGQT